MSPLSDQLTALDACPQAIEWARNYTDLESAWAACDRADWMLWLVSEDLSSREELGYCLMACDFAERALVHVPDGEDRPRQAIDVARRYIRGETTEEELGIAGADAGAAAGAAAWAAETAAGAAARAAAWAVETAAGVAQDAAEVAAGAAARAAAEADGTAAWAAAWAAESAAQADIIRSYWPVPPPSARQRLEGLEVKL